jgi:autotransporter passenger strand-loop-strand repeat protein
MSQASAFYSGTVGVGQVLSGVTVSAYQYVDVTAGGLFESSTILPHGSAYLGANGQGDALIVNGGTLFVDGKAAATTVTGGGEMEVNAGLAVSTTIMSGGDQFVAYDYANAEKFGRALDTKVGFGGSQRLFFGSAGNTVVSSGGVQEVETPGSLASNTQVYSGGEMDVYGIATDATIYAGATLRVGSNADPAGIVQAGGTLLVTQSGADLSALVLDSGATVAFLNGATASGLVVGAGVLVESGAVQINSATGAASLLVAVGNLLSGYTVGAEETETVNSGGRASATTVVNGGTQIVNSGGKATGSVLYHGSQTIEFGAKALDTDIRSGGYQIVSNGTATDTTVYSGGVQSVSVAGPAVTSGTVLSGGVELVNGQGRSVDTTVLHGGAEELYSFTSSTDTTVGQGGVEDVLGADASGTIVQGGGELLDFDYDATLTSCVVESGGYLVLSGAGGYNNGTVAQTTIQAGGHLVLFDAADTSGFSIASGAVVTSVTVAIFSGTEQVPYGRYVTDPHLSGGTIGAYATEVVASGGVVESTTITSGGSQSVQGGTAFDTILQADTVQRGGLGLLGPATMVGTVIESGGLQELYRGATATDTTIEAGGLLFFSSGLAVSNVSMSVGGAMTIAQLKYHSGGSVRLNAHDQLIVYEGGSTVEIQMVGNYSGAQFVASDGGDGATYITLSAAGAASAQAAQGGELVPALAQPLAAAQDPSGAHSLPPPAAPWFDAASDQQTSQPMMLHPHSA